MDGENHGKPYLSMDDLGVKPPILGNIQINSQQILGKMPKNVDV